MVGTVESVDKRDGYARVSFKSGGSKTSYSFPSSEFTNKTGHDPKVGLKVNVAEEAHGCFLGYKITGLAKVRATASKKSVSAPVKPASRKKPLAGV